MTGFLLELLKNAVSSENQGNSITPGQRVALREICSHRGDLRQRPEQLLVEFKACLHEAATQAGVPVGLDRNALIDRFVTAFIEELYRADSGTGASGDGAHHTKGGKEATRGNNPNFSDAHP
jgi:hypothetical protein